MTCLRGERFLNCNGLIVSFEHLELDAMTDSEVVNMLVYEVECLVQTFRLGAEVAEDAPTSIRGHVI